MFQRFLLTVLYTSHVYHFEICILSTHYICVSRVILTIKKKQFFSIWRSSTGLSNGSKMCALHIIFSYKAD